MQFAREAGAFLFLRAHQFAAEIVNGLREGERVVLHPSDRVVGGALIAARGS